MHWVPSKMQLADPLSRLQAQQKGGECQCMGYIYDRLRSRPEVYMGVLRALVVMKAA